MFSSATTAKLPGWVSSTLQQLRGLFMSASAPSTIIRSASLHQLEAAEKVPDCLFAAEERRFDI
jgi:hypothetical protein